MISVLWKGRLAKLRHMISGALRECVMEEVETHQPFEGNHLAHKSPILHFDWFLLLIWSHYDTATERIRQVTPALIILLAPLKHKQNH